MMYYSSSTKISYFFYFIHYFHYSSFTQVLGLWMCTVQYRRYHKLINIMILDTVCCV